MSIMAHGIDPQGVGIKQNIPLQPRSDGLEHSMNLLSMKMSMATLDLHPFPSPD